MFLKKCYLFFLFFGIILYTQKNCELITMLLSELIQNYIQYISSVKMLSANSVAGYKRDLEKLQKILVEDYEIDQITEDMIRLCVGQLARENKSSATINRFVVSCHSLFDFALRTLKVIKSNPAINVRTVKIAQKVPVYMTEGEVQELCTQPLVNELLWASRDRAIFTMLYSSGCRLRELCNIKLSDLRNDNHSAIVTGKGKKQRIVYFETQARTALETYLVDREKFLKVLNKKSESLFISRKGKGLSASGIEFILSKYSGEQGTNRHMNPHAFRHTFATQLLTNGADIRIVQELLGHENISTTQRYTHLTTKQLQDIYNKSHPHA